MHPLDGVATLLRFEATPGLTFSAVRDDNDNGRIDDNEPSLAFSVVRATEIEAYRWKGPWSDCRAHHERMFAALPKWGRLRLR